MAKPIPYKFADITLIGLSARKQGGKTTAAKHLLDTGFDGYRPPGMAMVLLPMATALKEIVGRGFFSPELQGTLYDPTRKTWPLETEEDKQRLLPCGLTVREVLQKMGKFCRDLDPDFLVRTFKDILLKLEWQASDRQKVVLVPDVRFPNEVKLIQVLGGHVIRLLRSPIPDTDESECALDCAEARTLSVIYMRDLVRYGFACPPPISELDRGDYFDALVDNRDKTIQQQNETFDRLFRLYPSWGPHNLGRV